MKFWVSFIFLLSLSSAQANRLAEYCENDPSGELYSSAWDADTFDFMEEIGLSLAVYGSIIDKVDESEAIINSFEDYVDLLKDDYPEFEYKFQIWKLETCINDGYEDLGYLTEK